MAIYQVNVAGKEYYVEIEDVNAQPIRAVVNGRVVEVWVKERELTAVAVSPAQASSTSAPTPVVSAGMPAPAAAQAIATDENEIRAPMPGCIVSVAVKPGDQVEVGQDVCVLEAMKMNNRIRATRAGRIAEVHVQPDQQVQHGDVLVTYAS
jgi:biotin carboxyl carrier protein